LLYYQNPIPSCLQLEKLKQQLADKQHCVLLENASKQQPPQGISIFAFAPSIRIEVKHNQLRCFGYDLKFENQSDPFAAMKEILAKYAIIEQHKLPFCGGFLGYIGYDHSKNLEQLPQLATDDIGLPEFAMGFYPVAIVVDHCKQQLSICGVDGFQKQADKLLKFCKLETPTPYSEEDFCLTGDWVSNLSKAEYVEKFNRVKQHIIQGDCYQVNLAQRWQAPFKGSCYGAYLKLKQHNQAPYSAFLKLGSKAILSVSPECFISASNGFCETHPIKGTRPRSSDPKSDQQLANELINSDKDRAENVMIVDLMRNDFSKVCLPNTVKVEKLCALESFAAVHHLVSSITGKLAPRKDNTDLLAACFPGGSITGAPKIRAMQIIESLEPHSRSVYCGCIGYLSCNGNMDTSIAIRTLVSANDHLYCWGGGGLVFDSDAEQEFLETHQKVAKILPILSNTKIPD